MTCNCWRGWWDPLKAFNKKKPHIESLCEKESDIYRFDRFTQNLHLERALVSGGWCLKPDLMSNYLLSKDERWQRQDIKVYPNPTNPSTIEYFRVLLHKMQQNQSKENWRDVKRNLCQFNRNKKLKNSFHWNQSTHTSRTCQVPIKTFSPFTNTTIIIINTTTTIIINATIIIIIIVIIIVIMTSSRWLWGLKSTQVGRRRLWGSGPVNFPMTRTDYHPTMQRLAAHDQHKSTSLLGDQHIFVPTT